MMSGFRTPLSLRTFLASTNGSSLVEFALISPILITLMVGSNELARWIRARQHMEDYATMVASDISGASAAVSPFTLAEMIERIGLVAPELVDPTLPAWNQSTDYLSVTISMAMMTNPPGSTCSTNCTYDVKMAWSFGNNKRNCSSTRGPPPSTPLPIGLDRQPGSAVIVDVVSKYKFVFGLNASIATEPTLSTTVWQPVRNWRGTGVFPPLSGATAGAWDGTSCP